MTKISAATAATSLGDTDTMPLASSGASKKITGANLRTSILRAGTSFPGSPATNDRYFRTDLGLEFYYDGTRWLTTELFTVRIGAFSNLSTSNTNDTAVPLISSSLKTWCVSLSFSVLVLSTNTGSAYWTLLLNKLNSAGSTTSVGSVNSSSLTVTTYNLVTTSVGAEIDPSSHPVLVLNATKTAGTPGPLYATGVMNFRLIAT